jgi:hypothetical protein
MLRVGNVGNHIFTRTYAQYNILRLMRFSKSNIFQDLLSIKYLEHTKCD